MNRRKMGGQRNRTCLGNGSKNETDCAPEARPDELEVHISLEPAAAEAFKFLESHRGLLSTLVGHDTIAAKLDSLNCQSVSPA